MDERGILNGERGSKVIVASQFTRLLNLFSAELHKRKVSHAAITGAVVGKARVAAKNSFQKDPACRVILLATKAGGVSLTLDQADDVIFLDETFDPDDQTQVEDRADRVSRSNHQVTIWYVRSLDTLEEAIAADNEDMNTMQHALLDGRRGVDRARKLMNYKTKR
jgi:SNF2 family DNA or RNA helicase